MAIDPSLSLQIRPPQITVPILSPYELANQRLTLRGLMQQGQLRDLQMQQEQQDVQDEQGIREFFRNRDLSQPVNPSALLRFGNKGLTLSTALLNQQKAQIDTHISQISEAKNGADYVSRLAGSIVDDDTLKSTIPAAVKLGVVTSDEGSQILNQGFSNPATQVWLKQKQKAALDYKEQVDMAFKNAQEKRAQLGFDVDLRKKEAEAAGAEWELAGRTAPNNQTDWDPWRAKLSAPLQAAIPAMFSPEARAAVLMKAEKVESGKTRPVIPEIQQQRIEVATAQAPKQLGVGVTPAAEAQEIRIADAKRKAEEASRPPTQAQETVGGYYRRLQDSETELNRLEKHMADMGLFGQTWYNYAPNWAQSNENQVMQQAARQFTEARLRKESGAAIAAHEFANDRQMYFPQPGDGPDVLARKKHAREVLIESFRRQAGKAVTDEEKTAPPPPAQDKTAAPAGDRTIDSVRTAPPGAPAIGTVIHYNGKDHVYRGGDPNLESNWSVK